MVTFQHYGSSIRRFLRRRLQHIAKLREEQRVVRAFRRSGGFPATDELGNAGITRRDVVHSLAGRGARQRNRRVLYHRMTRCREQEKAPGTKSYLHFPFLTRWLLAPAPAAIRNLCTKLLTCSVQMGKTGSLHSAETLRGGFAMTRGCRWLRPIVRNRDLYYAFAGEDKMQAKIAAMRPGAF